MTDEHISGPKTAMLGIAMPAPFTDSQQGYDSATLATAYHLELPKREAETRRLHTHRKSSGRLIGAIGAGTAGMAAGGTTVGGQADCLGVSKTGAFRERPVLEAKVTQA